LKFTLPTSSKKRAGGQSKKAGKGKKSALSGEVLCLNLFEQEAELGVLTSKITGEKQLERFASVELQNLSPDDAAAAIKKTIQEFNLTNPKLIGVVPSNFVVSRNIEIPSRDPNEIREILSLQASRHTPYARDEIVIDHIDLGLFKDVYTRVLFIIAPRKIITRYYSIAAKAGMEIEKVVFSPEAVARACWEGLDLLDEKPPIAVLNIAGSLSEFMVIDRGLVYFVRSIPVGAKHLAAAPEAYKSRFIAELRKSLDAYHSENIGLLPSKIFVGGSAKNLSEAIREAEEALTIPIKIFSETEALSLDPKFRDQAASENWPLLTVGAAGGQYESLTVDLSPEESKIKRSLEERSKQVIKCGILGMIFFGLMCLGIGSHIYFKAAKLQVLENKYAPIQKEVEALEKTYERVRIVKTHLAKKGEALETIVGIAGMIPKDLYLTEIKYDASSRRLGVKGSSYYQNLIFALVDEMEKSVLLHEAETKYITGRKEGKIEVSDFEIVASLE